MDEKNLYNLTPQEFEHFVAKLLPQAGYSDVRLVGGPGDKGVDLVGTVDDRTVAFQVKHKSRLSLQEVRRFAESYFADPSVPRNLVFVTSADLPRDVASVAASVPQGCELRFLGRTDILRLLPDHPSAVNRWLDIATKRAKAQHLRLLISVAGSLLGILALFYPLSFVPTKPLGERIQTVERALASMRDLESYLEDIKEDMITTEKETALINAEHAKAKELEKLTNQQLVAIQTALRVQNWRHTLFNFAMGLVSGIGSSLVASILHARWKQRKALR